MTNQQPLEVALSVSELVSFIKQQLENEFNELFLTGEISNLTQSSTGHWYFNISDQEATISCCLFRNQALMFKDIHKIKNGDSIKLYGNISLYTKRTTIQIIVKKIVLSDKEGELKKKFEALKAKLSQEGFFDLARKKKIPEYVKNIAVITAENAAALQDFLMVMKRRSLEYRITIIPSLVQGDQAPAAIIKALNKVEMLKTFDVVVLTRGGGSQEDLWCFNDEMLVRKIAECSVPVISAVGHEVDFTLADYVADLRCETPTSAAEVLSSKQLKMQEMFVRLQKQLKSYGAAKYQHIQFLTESLRPSYQIKILQNIFLKKRTKLTALKPQKHYLEKRRYQFFIDLERAVEYMASLVQKNIQHKMNSLDRMYVQVMALDPYKVLGRGYAIIQSPSGDIITNVKKMANFPAGAEVVIQFVDGKESLVKK